MTDAEVKPAGRRPRSWQWRTDLKWVAGIPFTIILGVTLLVLALFGITGKDNSLVALKSMKAPIMADAETRRELDARAPQLAVFLRDPEFAATVYDDPAAFARVVDAIPDVPAGVDPSADENGEIASQKGFKSMIGIYRVPLAVFNAVAHEKMGQALTVFLGLLLVTGIPFILLSRRSGRFLSLGISMAIASWAPLVVLHSMKGSLEEKLDVLMLEGAEPGQGLLAGMVRPFSDGVIGQAISSYRFFAVMAAALVLMAGLYFVLCIGLRRVWPVRHKPPAVA